GGWQRPDPRGQLDLGGPGGVATSAAFGGGGEEGLVEPDEIGQAALPRGQCGQIHRHRRLGLVVVPLALPGPAQPRQIQRPQVPGGELGPDTDNRPQQPVTVLVEEVVVAITVTGNGQNDVAAAPPRG